MHFLQRIVVKSPDIDCHISRIKKQPLDEADIARLWKIFSAVRQTITDPTSQATRLENFWWRVWGSKQKHLSGLSLGKICSGISDESSNVRFCSSQAFVENSYSHQRISDLHEKRIDKERVPGSLSSKPCKSSSSNKLNATGTLPHPILKKTRGTSTNGHRPTARFISPHETEDEDHNTCQTTENIPQPASNPSGGATNERKRRVESTVSKKKGAFVITKKKQAVILRRQSPSLSTDAANKVLGITRVANGTLSSSNKTNLVAGRQIFGRSRSQILEVSLSMSDTGSRNTTSDSLRSKNPISVKAESALQKLSSAEPIEHVKTADFKQNMKSANQSSPTLHESNDEISRLSSNHYSDKKSPSSQRKILLIDATPSQNEQGTVLTSSPYLNPSLYLEGSHSQGRRESKVEPHTSREEVNDNVASHEKTHEHLSHISSNKPIIEGKNKIDPYIFSTAPRCITKTNLSDQKKIRAPVSITAENIFAKMPIQSTPITLTSIEELGRSKSQLTLLLEKDRASIREKNSKQVKKPNKKSPHCFESSML